MNLITINNFCWSYFPLCAPIFFVKNLFLKAFAGTSVGRSTNATKNSFCTKKDFRFNRG
jgi:hypothetical protein